MDARRTADHLLALVLRKPSVEVCAGIVVCAAVLLNFGLAFLNARTSAITREHVIVGEMLIFGAALTICALSANRLMTPWFGVLWIMATILIASSVVRQSFEPKHFRDVLLIPVFIALGMTFARQSIVTLFCVLQSIILSVMVFEGLFPTTYGSLINPWSYYRSTRNFPDISWYGDSGLFLSSLRPQGRIFFDSLNIHRLSSVFVEPVSLGNWCVIVAIFTVTFWRQMTWRARAFFVVSEACLLVGSDGRLAFAVCLFISVLPFLAPRLPRYMHFFYLPAAILLVALIVWAFDLRPYADDFSGRIAETVYVLGKFDLPTFLGIDHRLISWTGDSGIGYAIVSQSIFGIIVLWTAICLLQPPTSSSTQIFIHGTCAYISMALMISGEAVFTIKTAAALWFLYGYVRARGFMDWQQIQAKVGHAL